MAEPPLFEWGEFNLSSGVRTSWRINCEALSDEDIETLAKLIAEKVPIFSRVEAVPTGGIRLASALERYTSRVGPLLIVDDVLTTGASMERQRDGRDAIGYVIFQRSLARPAWVKALWLLD